MKKGERRILGDICYTSGTCVVVQYLKLTVGGGRRGGGMLRDAGWMDERERVMHELKWGEGRGGMDGITHRLLCKVLGTTL